MPRAWYARLLHAAIGYAERRKPPAQRSLGATGEDLAYWYLREHGFTMVARNYSRPGVGGEVDLIGWDAGILVFVEVKTRSSDEVRKGEDAVNVQKRRHLVAAAGDYRRRAHVEAPYRFDVVAVYPQPGTAPRVEHLRDAFSETDILV